MNRDAVFEELMDLFARVCDSTVEELGDEWEDLAGSIATYLTSELKTSEELGQTVFALTELP